eukprot:4239663-Pyramimonas_sp.AAC.1
MPRRPRAWTTWGQSRSRGCLTPPSSSCSISWSTPSAAACGPGSSSWRCLRSPLSQGGAIGSWACCPF